MAENKYLRERLGELMEDEAQGIIDHLRFCQRLEQLVKLNTGHIEGDAGVLADRVEWLLHLAVRRQAIHDLGDGQCDGMAGEHQCELGMGHDGEHELIRSMDWHREKPS